MKTKLTITLLLLQLSLVAFAQDTQKPVVQPVRFYIGLQPGFMPTFVDQWGQTVWDFNLVPLTFVYAVNRHWALRVHSIYNLGVGSYNQAATVSNIGLEFAAPFYLSLKNNEEGHRGFFLAPVLTPGFNKNPGYYTLGVGAEAGFSFLFKYRWSLNVSAQAGVKFQKFPEETFVRRVPYTLPVLGIGIWL